MKKFLLYLSNKEKNNKAFTIIELIIVVAIIAVLAAVLAPQYLRFVEDANKTTDKQTISNLIKLSQISVIAESDNIPPNTIVEVLWATGYGDGHTYDNWLLVREAYSGTTGRVSAIKPDDYTRTNANLSDLQKIIVGGMHLDATLSGFGDYYAVLEGDKSQLTKTNNFALHINSSTGEMALAFIEGGDGVKNIWIDELGIDLIPVP